MFWEDENLFSFLKMKIGVFYKHGDHMTGTLWSKRLVFVGILEYVTRQIVTKTTDSLGHYNKTHFRFVLIFLSIINTEWKNMYDIKVTFTKTSESSLLSFVHDHLFILLRLHKFIASRHKPF